MSLSRLTDTQIESLERLKANSSSSLRAYTLSEFADCLLDGISDDEQDIIIRQIAPWLTR